jgi:hypothetical protein
MGGIVLLLAPPAGLADELIHRLSGRDGCKQTSKEVRAKVRQAHFGRHDVHGIKLEV